VHPWTLVRAFLSAFALCLPSTQAIINRHGQALGTKARSTLSYALRRLSMLRFVTRMIKAFDALFCPGDEALVALDSMAVTLPATRRHGCEPINSAAVGGGVLWAFVIDAVRGACPVKILRIITGPWHDTREVAEVSLTPCGPVYLMDRGFWKIDLINKWLSEQVRFIVRVTAQSLCYKKVRLIGRPRLLESGIRIEFDGVARLGGVKQKVKPLVRLVVAYLRNGEDIILASDRMEWSAERLLEAYGKRWQIEIFHRFLKESIGLAHLYSFQENGLLFLLHVATLLAILLVLAEEDPSGTTLSVLLVGLEQLRTRLGIPPTAWRSNTVKALKRKHKKKKGKPPKNH
jgi:hypothetical protein